MITKELIIDTATALFIQNGVKSITIDRIVKELHTSKRTIYNHFEERQHGFILMNIQIIHRL